jgi:hypothetical protein
MLYGGFVYYFGALMRLKLIECKHNMAMVWCINFKALWKMCNILNVHVACAAVLFYGTLLKVMGFIKFAIAVRLVNMMGHVFSSAISKHVC